MTHRILISLLGVISTAVLWACNTQPPTTPSTDTALFGKTAPSPKLDICHFSKEEGTYHNINISGNAEEAHRAHGDGQAGDPVPGMDGYVFDDGCVPIPDTTCPCYTAADLDARDWFGKSAPPVFRDVGNPKLFVDILAGSPGDYLQVSAGATCYLFDDDDNIFRNQLITREECEVCADLIRDKARDLGLIP